MSTVDNKQIVLDAYSALVQGNPASYVNALSNDVRHTFFGNHRLSRTYHGKEDLRKNLLVPCGKSYKERSRCI